VTHRNGNVRKEHAHDGERERFRSRHAVARRVLLPIALAAIGVAAGGAPASAATPVHAKRTVGPIIVDVAAGALCDFNYDEEDSYTQTVIRFLDDAGNLVRVEDAVDLTVLHRNADTGQTLIEEVHYAAYVDFVGGVARVTGESWHLRDEGGRPVLSGAGLIATDLTTGEVLTQTSDAKADFAATICPALGGAPAS
jgi:hypothetical protein